MRSVARANMKASGMGRINKKRMVQGKHDREPRKQSNFAIHWREYAEKDTLFIKAQAAKKKKLAALKKMLGRKKTAGAL